MKRTAITTIRTLSVAFAFCALSLSSCKGEGERNNGDDTISNTKDTLPDEGMTARPMGDTIVKKNGDTIVKTGTDGDTKGNPIGEQVP